MTPHLVLELRTDRHSENTPETAVQLFSTLPTLRNNLWWKLLKQDEHLSFEILVQNQTIYFLCYLPERLEEYVKGIIKSSYPEALLTRLTKDPIAFLNPDSLEEENSFINQQSPSLTGGSFKLKYKDVFPIKNYKDFADADPLAPVLSTLSKLGPFDQLVIQIVIEKEKWGWKSQSLSPDHPQKAIIESKINSSVRQVCMRILVRSTDQTRTNLLLDTIASSFQSTTQSEGNKLILKKNRINKNGFLSNLVNRTTTLSPKFHLTLEELATIYHLPNKKLSHVNNIAWGKNLLGEPPENLPILTREMPLEEKKEINAFARTVFKNNPTAYGIKRYDRRKHFYVIGKTGTGKSTLLANMAINDLRNDEGICVIDPHGDLVETLLDYIPSHRINDCIYFDPADPERTVKINLFEGESVAHRELIASGIVSIFQKLYSYSWGPRLEYILRNTLLTLLTSKTSKLSDILDLLTNPKVREKIIENLDDPVLRNFWVHEFEKMPDRQRVDAVSPILNKVGQFVTSPLIRDVVNAEKSSISIEDIMNGGKILLVNLSQGRLGEDNATLLGAMLITKIQLAAMARVNMPEEDRRDFYLYVDEFQNFATESFNKILSEARKYRLNLTLANQYIAQIPEEVQKAIFGNCGSMASFIMGADDAAVFEREFGGKYTKEDLVSLSRHQIINKLSIDNITSTPFPALTLPPAKNKNSNKEKVLKVSRERYATKKERNKVTPFAKMPGYESPSDRKRREDKEKEDKKRKQQAEYEAMKKAREEQMTNLQQQVAQAPSSGQNQSYQNQSNNQRSYSQSSNRSSQDRSQNRPRSNNDRPPRHDQKPQQSEKR